MYARLVAESPEDPPDLVIGGALPDSSISSHSADSVSLPLADTVVVLPQPSLAILEKPRNIIDQMGMLQDYSGMTISVVTAVTLGTPLLPSFVSCDGLTILSDSTTANRSSWIFAVFPHRLFVVCTSQLI